MDESSDAGHEDNNVAEDDDLCSFSGGAQVELDSIEVRMMAEHYESTVRGIYEIAC